MCGISGIINFGQEARDLRNIVQIMNSSMVHRGPDDSGLWSDDKAFLGHVRLSIIDLSKNGSQPMSSFNNRFVISYNGEIYNYRSLRNELAQKGIEFKSSSDTEVVVNGWEVWGETIVEKMNGIFSFAIWDRQTDSLFLVRDRFGVKPLFFLKDNERIIFCSDVKSIIKAIRLKYDINIQALHEYIYFGASHGKNTLVESIKRVEPAEILTFRNGNMSSRKYWKIEDIQEVETTEDLVSVDLASKAENAIRRQLISDVPIGIFLSGGVDSSIITAYASKFYEGTLNTYTAGFDFDIGLGSELGMAKFVSKKFGTHHHELIIKGIDLPKVIDELVDHHGVPFGDAANIPLYLVSRELNGNPKVMLQGDGGDELFGGYRTYKFLKHFHWWKLLSHLSVLVNWRVNSDLTRRLKRILEAFSNREKHLILAYLSTTDTRGESLFHLVSDDFKMKLSKTNPFEHFEHYLQKFNGRDIVQQMLYIDMNTQLPNVFLEKVDRATMAFGIESRVPFLDNDLAEYALSLPSRYKVRGKTGKLILRKAMRGIVPDEVLNASKKGFGVPYSIWLATSLYNYAQDIFTTELSSGNSIFDRERLLKMLSNHRDEPRVQSGYILWKALNLALWKCKLNEW